MCAAEVDFELLRLRVNRHSVTLVLRSEEKGKQVLARHDGPSKALISVAIVPDFTKSGAFDACLSSSAFDAVVHTASPYYFTVSDINRELLEPSIVGTTALLAAVRAYAPSVHKVVCQTPA